jgi:tRNA-specific 2-thiouridylase
VALGEPRYVTGIDAGSATVTIGRKEDLAVDLVDLESPGWVWGPPPDGADVAVQVRAHGEAVPATIRGRRLELATPELGVAPGQTAAVYDGDEVIGGGIVAAAWRGSVTSSAGTTRERP